MACYSFVNYITIHKKKRRERIVRAYNSCINLYITHDP